ncbi:uncharacterized protein THITE_2122489 [Thermothielavioides terrestris NRRL 8126]|uniref:Uncharacterized protein n=1 Tax=Thermothielavioides terrestris (strain ATCC 38088 / NRRL 8126) TaxID=578455 RepID=G2RDC0_THETT|nr:uncharacterized protein THITE_2122489 [Thermothielavioides terrestris NRRL 8126]AEO70759.1 hypothetical protein THITE_2122489 [Thermothielavioides terrestris NRRL 8126]
MPLPGSAAVPPRAGPRPPYSWRPLIWPRPGRRVRPRASALTALAFAALGLAACACADPTLPYVPTTILLPSGGSGTDGSVAYIFAPAGDDPNAVDFLAVNISSTIHAASLQPTKLTATLPFLSPDGGSSTTFAPILLPNGTIAVVAGDCSAGSSSSLWTYTPGPAAEWTQHAITPSADWDDAQSGPYHLGGALSFSAQLSPVLSPPTLYLYGGMCPSANASSPASPSTWQSAATYSNRMLRLSPGTSSSSYTLTYALPTGQQPPVAEAGFTLTELPPSITNLTATAADNNGGSEAEAEAGGAAGLVTQQTTHVLLGGHTRGAFVNMSTAALWSLPEETWAFVGIAPPPAPSSSSASAAGDDGRNTELAVLHRRGNDAGAAAAVTAVDSRSGHTAVLSADGTRLVVYGGWVGDVGTPAEPQLVVLRVGVGLSGWVWEVPPGQPGGEGKGVYGHGAALLPGNVMMVYGGYEISAAGAGGGVKRRQVVGGGGRMFYNITSMTWSDEYVSPLAGTSKSGGSSDGGSDGGGGGTGSPPGSSTDGSGSSRSDDSSLQRKIGLGVGLGVGLLVLLVLAGLGLRWFRRKQQRRAARDEALRGLAQGVGVNGSLPRAIGEDDEMLERDHSAGIFPWTAAAAREWYTGGHDPYTQGRRSLGYETLRGGARGGNSLYIPPRPLSSSGLSGRPRAARGLYQPTTGSAYDFTPLSRAPNRIEPIYEADEDEDGDLAAGHHPLSPDKDERDTSTHNNNNNNNNNDDDAAADDDDDDDPFLTPTTAHTPVGGLFPPPSSHPSPRTSHSPTPPPPAAPQQQAGTGQHQDADVQVWVSDVDASDPHALFPTTMTTTQGPGRTASSAGAAGAAATGGGAARRPPVSSSAAPSLVSSSSSSASDDGRTGSNLSERSAFSFVRGAAPEDRVLLSRLRTTLAASASASSSAAASAAAGGGAAGGGAAGGGGGGAAGGGAGGGGLGAGEAPGGRSSAQSHAASSGSSSSGSGGSLSYSTARSNFAALRAEGPGLLMGGGSNDRASNSGGGGASGQAGDADEADWEFVPGSPSKSKPRRSWLGSLKRVFSGGSSTPESGRGSHEDVGSSSPTREGLLWSSSDYDGRLFGGEGGTGGGGLQRRRQGREAWLGGAEGDEDDWDRDIERAAEQRTVQIMFTVPREPLRVVNAEIEREESVLIVDPDDEDCSSSARTGADAGAGADGRASISPAHGERPVEGLREEETEGVGLRPPQQLEPTADHRSEAEAANQLSTGGLESPVGVSPTPSLRASTVTTPTLLTAEEVRMERPRTRVREMVESIESRSRDGSPASSPERRS